MSGMMTGHLITKMMDADPTQKPITRAAYYRQWLQSWFFQDVEHLKNFYAPFFQHFPSTMLSGTGTRTEADR
jgi:hypothetical protein